MKKFVSIYQPVTSPHFYSAINANKNLEMYKVTDKYLQKYAKTACRSKEWDSLPFQEFGKVFMGENTPYNSILITWGTGVGKTCGAVQITEALRTAVQMFNKSIYIIAPANLQQNYKETLLSECSGMRIPSDVSPEERYNYISNTYKFYSYIKFGKLVEKIYEQGGEEALLKKFSNCVFVIDEAHNLNNLKEDTDTQNEMKESKNNDKEIQRKLLNTLELLFESIKNSKLILLTATPIRNSITEIVSLVNLLRLNNNEKRIDENIAFVNDKHFNRESFLNNINVDYLLSQLKGYISYVRGNSQISFPRIEDIGEIINNYPSRSPEGQLVNYQMKYTKVIPCEMNYYQLAGYLYYNLPKNILNQRKNDMFNVNLLTLSDVVLPQITSTGIIDPKNLTSKDSLRKFIQYNRSIGKYELLSSGQIYNEENRPIDQTFFLCKEFLPYFSTKLNTLLDNLLQEGVHYVYCKHVEFGTNIILIACQLYGWNVIKVNSDNEVTYKYTITPNDHIIKRCWCGQLEPNHAADHPFEQGHVIDYTGSTNTNQKILKNILDIVNSEKNKQGQLCKVFIGSSVSGEGVNYKRLRYVHIFEPWWNNTVLQQVIGRAARNCSHFDLPKSQQNVMVYRYITVFPKSLNSIQNIFPNFVSHKYTLESIIKNNETVDMSMYRLSEQKDLEIAFLTRILKRSAVDCENNYIWNRVWTEAEIREIERLGYFEKNGKRYNISKNTIDLLNRGTDNSADCEYQKCDYDCMSDEPLDTLTKDFSDDTVLYSYINSNKQKILVKINQIIEFIQKLHTPMFNLAQLLKYFNINPQQSIGFTKFDYYNIFDAITEMLTNQDIIFEWNGMTGRLILLETSRGLIYSFDAFAKYIDDPTLIPEFFKYNNVFTNGSDVMINMKMVTKPDISDANDYRMITANNINLAISILESGDEDIIKYVKIFELFDNMNDKLYKDVMLTPFNLMVELYNEINIKNITLENFIQYYLLENYRTTKNAIDTFYISWTDIVGTNPDKITTEIKEIKTVYDWTVHFYCRYKVNGYWEYYRIIYLSKGETPFDTVNFYKYNFNFIVQQKRVSEEYYTINDEYTRDYIGGIMTEIIANYKQTGQIKANEQAAIVYEYFAPNLFDKKYNVRIVNQSRGNVKENNQIDKRSISTGQDCNTTTKSLLIRSLEVIKDIPEIKEIIKNINSTKKVYANNAERCKTIEYLFRALDIQKRNGKRWFYMYGNYDLGNYKI